MNRYLSFFACLIFFSCTFAGINPCITHQCIAVVDAGSTGSRLHIFQYDLDKKNNPISIQEFSSKKISPGFSTIALNQKTVNEYLSKLFSDAQSSIIPVYFYSTAGMRLLPSNKQSEYYKMLQTWFAEQSAWQLVEGKTITGSQEGIFGWLAVNYQLGRFDSDKKPLVSVMDMGGASVQVAFPITNPGQEEQKDVVDLDIYNRHIKLYAHSFLGLGLTEVLHQFLDTSSCFADDYELPNGEMAKGDASLCTMHVFKLINGVHSVGKLVKSIIEANHIDNWYVVGGLSMVVQQEPFIFTNNKFTMHDLIDQANSKVCNESWSNLNSKYSNNDYMYSYCFAPSYYYALLVGGYGLKADQTVRFMSNKEKSNDWTFGVVLQHH